MRDVIVNLYASAYDREAKHGTRLGGQFGPAWAKDNPTGFRAYMLVGRYAKRWQDEPMYWVVAPDGRRFWMMAGMYRVWIAVEARLKAGRDLRTGHIAIAANVSQGYVSKVIKRLEAFGFLTILGVWRGRWGRIVAKLRQSFLPKTYVGQGGMIKYEGEWIRPREVGRRDKIKARREARYTNPWGSWLRAWDRIEGKGGTL